MTKDVFSTLQADDRVFPKHGPPSELAEIGSLGSADYLGSYKDAADRLVEQASDGQMDPDLLFLPIAFLYRHWTELALKTLLSQAGQDSALGHNLVELYEKLQRRLEVLGVKPDSNDRIMDLMKEWQKYDEWATAFRYSTDRQKNASLAQFFREEPEFQSVNIVRMAETMTKLENEFHGHSAYLSEMSEMTR